MQPGFTVGGAGPFDIGLMAAGLFLFSLAPSTVTLILGLLNVALGLLRIYTSRKPAKRLQPARLVKRFWKERRRRRELERRLRKYEEV